MYQIRLPGHARYVMQTRAMRAMRTTPEAALPRLAPAGVVLNAPAPAAIHRGRFGRD